MSIKDYEKIVSVTNMTTNDVCTTYDWYNLTSDYSDGTLFCQIGLEEYSFLRLVERLLKNQDNVSITIGYKP